MALRIDAWVVEFRPWGWVRLKEEGGGGPTVYLQYREAGPADQSRFDLQSVVMRAGGDEALSGRTWRRLPLSAVEGYIQWPQVQRALTQECATAAPPLDALEDYFAATADAPENPADQFLISSDSYAGDASMRGPATHLPVIKPPDGRITDDFLRDVAEVYRHFAATKKAPAPAIAELAEVPVRTVHRWVYEARKRGILPPARAGRAG